MMVHATDGGLAQHFAARRMQSEHWDPQCYMQGTLLQYTWAFSTMLTGKVHGVMGRCRLLPATQSSLVILLSLPDSTWRPAAVAIICAICKDGAPVRETTFPAQKLLADVLKQLEFVALRLTASGRPAARTPTYMAVIKAAVAAGAHKDADRELRAALGDGALCRLALSTMESLPRTQKLVGGITALIRDLYLKDQYNDRHGGKLARAVVLSVEASERLRAVRDGGFVARWEGEITVEHLLPQNKRALKPYWQERFGEPKGPTHTTFVHKLGNLSILSRGDNSRMSDREFDAKLVMMNEMELDYRTLDMVMKLDGCPLGWSVGAILERQRWLLERLAQRFKIDVPESNWTEWRDELLHKAGDWQQLLGGQELLSGMCAPANGSVAGGSSGSRGGTGVGGAIGSGMGDVGGSTTKTSNADPPSREKKRKHTAEPAVQSPQGAPGAEQSCATVSAAAAGEREHQPADAEAAGAPEHQPAGPEAARPAGAQPLSDAPELFPPPRKIVDAALAGTLEPEDALQLLLSVQTWRLPVSTAVPRMPPVGHLYLFDTREVRNYKTDGHSWKTKPTGGWSEVSKTFKFEEDMTMVRVTSKHESGTLKRCTYHLKFSMDADVLAVAGVLAAESYKLMHYAPA